MPKLLSTTDYYTVLTYKHELQMSNLQIAAKLGITRKTVAAILKRHSDTGSPEPLIKGRKRKTKFAKGLVNRQQIDALERMSRTGPFKTPRILKEALGLECSLTTIKRRLNDSNLNGHRAAVKQMLTENAVRRRLEFANLHRNFNWDNVVFSDEVKIETAASGLEWVRRPPDQRYQTEYIREVDRQGRVALLVWGAFSKKAFFDLVFLEGSLNSQGYINKILEPRILPYKRKFKNMILMQDNASCHKAYRVTDFFRDNEIDTIKWPSKSPDMNPIENLWRILKIEVGCLNQYTKYQIDEVKQKIKNAWNKIKRGRYAMVQKIYREGMNKRMEAVIAANGHHTKW